MGWFRWTLIVLWVIGPIAEVFFIDKPREPKTRGDVAASIAMSALLIYGALSGW